MTDQRIAKPCTCASPCDCANTQSACNCAATNANITGQMDVCESGCSCGVNCACTAETNCLVS